MSLKRRGGKASTDRVDTPAIPIHGVGLPAQKSLKHAAAPQALKCIPEKILTGNRTCRLRQDFECDAPISLKFCEMQVHAMA